MIKYGGYAIGAFLVFWLAIMVGHVIIQPIWILSKTFDANNVISTYEWFYNANAAFNARVSQTIAHKVHLEQEQNPEEKIKLRIELGAVQQSCRDLAQRYNANAAKANQSIFMGHDVPDKLNPKDCE